MKKRTQLTKEEIRDLFPLETIIVFKKLKCFDKLLDELTKWTNKEKTAYEIKVKCLSDSLIYSPKKILLRTFTWIDSINGFSYWQNIYSKLEY